MKRIYILLIIFVLFGCNKREEIPIIEEPTNTTLPLIVKDDLKFEYASDL